jgi:hypothetical protein
MINDDLIKLMDDQAEQLAVAFRRVKVANLPSVPVTVRKDQSINGLPVVPAIYFIRGTISTWKGDMGGSEDSKARIQYYRRNPDCKQKYRRTEGPRTIMYIGRASNVAERWRPTYNLYRQIIGHHHRYRETLDHLGSPRIHWLEMPKRYLAISEVVLIRLHQPAWNRQP